MWPLSSFTPNLVHFLPSMGGSSCAWVMPHVFYACSIFSLNKGSVPPFSFLKPRSHVVLLVHPGSFMLIEKELYLDEKELR